MIESQVFQLNVTRIVALRGECRAEAMGWNPVEVLKIFFWGVGGGGLVCKTYTQIGSTTARVTSLFHFYSHSSQFISFCTDKSCQPNFFRAMIYFLCHS